MSDDKGQATDAHRKTRLKIGRGEVPVWTASWARVQAQPSLGTVEIDFGYPGLGFLRVWLPLLALPTLVVRARKRLTPIMQRWITASELDAPPDGGSPQGVFAANFMAVSVASVGGSLVFHWVEPRYFAASQQQEEIETQPVLEIRAPCGVCATVWIGLGRVIEEVETSERYESLRALSQSFQENEAHDASD